MRSFVVLLVGTFGLSGVAHAQSAAPTPDKGYVEAVAQSTFGNVTSQAYGGEFGISIKSGIQVFVDAGQVRDASPSQLGMSAGLIAGSINGTARSREPITFGLAGVRYGVPLRGPVEPYVLAGGGVARVKKDVTFM